MLCTNGDLPLFFLKNTMTMIIISEINTKIIDITGVVVVTMMRAVLSPIDLSGNLWKIIIGCS